MGTITELGTITVQGRDGDPAEFSLTSPFITQDGTMTATAERDGVAYVFTVRRAS